MMEGRLISLFNFQGAVGQRKGDESEYIEFKQQLLQFILLGYHRQKTEMSVSEWNYLYHYNCPLT